MTDLLIRRFVADYEQTDNPKVRERYGMLSGMVGIGCNLLLFSFKLMAGTMSGAISIIADAFNNLSDAGSSIVTLIGFKMAGKPPDPAHPFGHGRIEYLAGLFIAMAIVLVSVELFRSSIEKILSPEATVVNFISIGILITSILAKFWLAFFYKKIGTRIGSSAIAAATADSVSDCVATTVVLLGLGIHYFTGLHIDGYAGMGVALFIFYTGVITAKETLQPLLGQPPQREYIEKIEQKVLAYPNIIGMHDLMVHDYGPGRMFISLHAEVPASMDVLCAHELIDQIEMDLRKVLHCDVTIHMDPIILDDPRLLLIRGQVETAVSKVDAACSMHDFRMTSSHGGFNLIFDVVIPGHLTYTHQEIKAMIASDLTRVDQRYNAVIKIDYAYL